MEKHKPIIPLLDKPIVKYVGKPQIGRGVSAVENIL
jgi:hypothetical protein